MFNYLFILIILLSVTLFPSAIEIFFSPEEMTKMGIRLESGDAG